MTSNAFSKRQGFLKNASICKPPPPPPPPPPPDLPDRECWLTPAPFSIPIGDTEPVDTHACCPDLPEDEHVDVECVAVKGSFSAAEGECTNCTDVETWPYEPPDEEGEDLITCTFTWSDEGQCQATCVVTVLPEENGDNDEE